MREATASRRYPNLRGDPITRHTLIRRTHLQWRLWLQPLSKYTLLVWIACLIFSTWNRGFMTAFVIITSIWFTAIVINDFLLSTRLVLNQSLFRQHRTWFTIRWLGNLLMVLMILGSVWLFISKIGVR